MQIGGASKRRLPSDYSWADQWVACNASLHSQVCRRHGLLAVSAVLCRAELGSRWHLHVPVTNMGILANMGG